MKKEYMEAFAEVNEIIKLMPTELVNKIPEKFKEIVKEERDKTYLTSIEEPLEKCKLKNETIVILGLIYRDFLCLEEERRRLQEKDAKELQLVKKELEAQIKEKYSVDKLFVTDDSLNKTYMETNKEASLEPIVKEQWYKKIFNIVRGIFKNK